MRRIVGLVAWICRTLVRAEIELVVAVLTEMLAGRRRDIAIRDDFRQKHPHYRQFAVDPLAPRTRPPLPKPSWPTLDWRKLLADYPAKNGRPLSPVKRRSAHSHVPASHTCPHCDAPSVYLYFNDGQKRTQLRCKVCGGLSPVQRRLRKTERAKYWCPYCGHALYHWKKQPDVTVYKCGFDDCSAYLRALARLNPAEKKLRQQRSSQFSVRYIYREYHFHADQLRLPSPQPSRVDLARIHSPDNVLGLVLTYHISYGLSARTTASLLRNVHQIPLSYQTVLNYCEAAAVHLHRFNLACKGPSDPLCAGDEVYVKIAGQWAYTFLFLGAQSHKITSYHVADARDTHNATIAMSEVARTAPDQQTTHLIFDGLPAYPAGVHFLNAERKKNHLPPAFTFNQVFGRSAELRPKPRKPRRPILPVAALQTTHRTPQPHLSLPHPPAGPKPYGEAKARAAAGFDSLDGALVLTVLFTTYYNFLRPHMTLDGDTPVHLDELDRIPTLQARWCKLLDLAMTLPIAA